MAAAYPSARRSAYPGAMSSLVRVLAALIVAGAAACGGDDAPADGDAGNGDGGIDAPLGPCDPLMPAGQQNCEVGKRCAWISTQDTPPRTGKVECVVDGTLPLGAVCEPSAAGQPDRCTTGLVCAGGTCADICGFDGSAAAGCAADLSCARYDGLFASGDDVPFLGACRPTCDPLTQRRAGGDACEAGEGCYLVTSATDTVAVCAKAGTGTHGQDLAGAAFANTCVPGAQPRRKDSASMTAQCGGLCRPVDVTSTMARGSEGGLAPDSCELRWGAAPPDNGGLGESCRYWSGREAFAGLSPYSDAVGWCFKHVGFVYDPDGDGTADSQFPRCAGLTMGDVIPPIGTPPHNDAAYFWCLAMGQARAPMITLQHARTDRLAP